MSMKKQKIAVVGAGIVGVSTAEWLRRDGHDVTLIDRKAPGEETSHGNAGILACCAVVPVMVPGMLKKAPGMLLNPEKPLFLRWSYLPKLLPWLIPYLARGRKDKVQAIAAGLAPLLTDAVEQHQSLVKGTPAEKWLIPGDYIYLYRTKAAFEADGFGWNLRAQYGITGEEMSPADLKENDPALSDAYRFGYRLGHHGHVANPGQYVKDLAAWFEGQGGTFLQAEVMDIAPREGGVTIQCTNANVEAERVVIASGIWSAKLAEKLGHKPMMEAERGYHVAFEGPSHTPPSPYMVADGKFVATPMAGEVRAAGVVEYGGIDAPASAKPIALLEKGIRGLYPDFAYQARRDWMGRRPATVDSLPLLGPSSQHPSVYFACGHQHVGLTAGPKSGRLIADMIAGRRANIDLDLYRVNRFE